MRAPADRRTMLRRYEFLLSKRIALRPLAARQQEMHVIDSTSGRIIGHTVGAVVYGARDVFHGNSRAEAIARMISREHPRLLQGAPGEGG